ncbi:MAG: acyl carrier protein [Chloroflexi bacterium]|nr:acyl carrier protein [Chloroflexota bacterium]MCH7652059.1 acyl carrier protein [Chloroflexota bacterium]
MEVKTLIKGHILNEIIQNSDLQIGDDTPLIDEGYLTSLQAVELVMFLEDQFEVEIDPIEVDEENFRDLTSITQLIEGKLA